MTGRKEKKNWRKILRMAYKIRDFGEGFDKDLPLMYNNKAEIHIDAE